MESYPTRPSFCERVSTHTVLSTGRARREGEVGLAMPSEDFFYECAACVALSV